MPSEKSTAVTDAPAAARGSRFLVRIVLAIVVISCGTYFALQKKGQAGDEVLQESRQLIAQADMYKGNEATFDALLESAHEQAFDDAYTMGGRHTRAKF